MMSGWKLFMWTALGALVAIALFTTVWAYVVQPMLEKKTDEPDQTNTGQTK